MSGISEKAGVYFYGGFRKCINLFFEDKDERPPTIGRYGRVEMDETCGTQKVCVYFYSYFIS